MNKEYIPNYRKANCCQLCKHYDDDIAYLKLNNNNTECIFHCWKYDTGVYQEWICDSFEHYEERIK